jgi:rhodanese-related sulfurtransferase
MSPASPSRVAAALLLLPLLPALASALWHPRRPDWAALRAAPPPPSATETAALRRSLAEIRAALPHTLWIDARPPEEHAAGHIPDALPLHEGAWDEGFARVVERWDGETAIVVYCGGEGCRASESVALRLRSELGFAQVFVLAGGWDAWRADSPREDSP